jgi:exopolysaccharide biosynthesis polyprenyl glycosylphosphotransferase
VSKIQAFPFLLAPDRRAGAEAEVCLYATKNKVSRKTRFLIAGAGWAGQTIAEEILKHGKADIVGFLDDRHEELGFIEISGNRIQVLSSTKKIGESLEKYNATDLVVAVTHEREDHLLKGIMDAFESDIQVHQMPDLYGKLTGKIPLKHIDAHWVVPHLKAPEVNVSSMIINFLDYSFALLLTIFVFLPLFPLVALLIKLSSPGPIFFFQKRIGLKGKRFTIFKFRTMTHKARKQGASWTTADDARVTKTGSFFRKFRIDELPQLLNVLRGDMALVGPRPEAVDLVALYRKEIPFYEYRYLVKPGITGWAQVEYRNTCSVDGALKKLQYDLYWIKKRSCFFHLKVILKTIRVTLTGFGSV